MRELLKQLMAGESLTVTQAQTLMTGWLQGEIPEAMTGALLVALNHKGIAATELLGMAQVIREVSLQPLGISPLIDTCGTGGSGSQSFNISTAVAFVAAACGVAVAKHGNRSASGTVGSADVLEYVGINLHAPLAQVRDAVQAVGVTFLFAPGWHPALKAVAPVRKQLGIRTIFNLLGPLVNPLAPTAQVLGVAQASLVTPMAEVLQALGCTRGLVLFGQEGLDEAGLGAPTTVAGFCPEGSWQEVLTPEDLQLTPAPTTAIQGGTVADNAYILQEVLQGRGTQAQRDIVVLNASAALQVGGRANSWAEGITQAQDCLDSGAAWSKLEALRDFLR